MANRPNEPGVSLRELRRRLDAGETTSTELVKGALLRIADPAGEGRRTFTDVFRESALAAAEASASGLLGDVVGH